MAANNTDAMSDDDDETVDSTLKTNFTVLKCSKTWEIKNFSGCWLEPGEKLDSPVFCSEHDRRIVWCLSLYPAGKNNNVKDNLSLYLTLKSLRSRETEIRVKYKFSILNDKGETANLYENAKGTTLLLKLNKDRPQCGVDEFVARNFLLDSANGLLPDDKLTISCELCAATVIPPPLTYHISNIHQTDQWCYTQMKVIETSYLWTIKNFSFCKKNVGEPIFSSVFSADTDDKHSWHLELFPDGDSEESKGYISVFLMPATLIEADIQVSFAIRIVGAQSRNIGITSTKPEVWGRGEHMGRGYSKLLSRHRLLDKANHLLVDDKLTILCAVRYVTETVDFSEKTAPKKLQGPKSCGLADNYETLLTNKKFSDVTLIVDGKELRVHKAILAARSPVFSGMFEHKSSDSSNDAKINIVDIDYELLQEIVTFIYTGTAKNLATMATTLLRAADFYILEDLKFKCEEQLVSKLGIENAVDMLILADKYNAKRLKTQAIDFIIEHAKIMVENQGFKKMTASHPQLLSEIGVKRFLASNKD